MRKLKFSLGEGGAKGFLIRHVEKIVMLTAVLMVAVFFCVGYSVEGLPSSKTPSSLKTLVSEVRRHIDSDTWEIVKPSRLPPLNHPQRVDEGRERNEDRLYPLFAFENPSIRQKTLRTDPKLSKPVKLEVIGKWVPLAYVPTRNDIDKLFDKELATVKERPSKSSPKPKKTPDKSKGDAYDPLALGGVPPGGEEDSGGSMPYAIGGDEIRQLTPTQMASIGTMVAQGDAVAKSKFLVAIKAVVPYELQWKEFERCFSNSNDYNPDRDVPYYRWFFVERAEVPADPQAALTWTPLSTKDLKNLADRSWVPVSDEIADFDFTDEVLTLPMPPVLLDELKKWALHSEVPERKDVALDQEEMDEEPIDGDGPDGPSASVDGSATGAEGGPRTRPGRDAYGTGMPRGPGAGMPRDRGAGTRPGGGTRPPSAMPGPMGRQGAPPGYPGGQARSAYPSSGMGGSAPGRSMPPGMRTGLDSSSYGGGPSLEEFVLPKYKLIRFYDLKAEAGKTYRYRIKVQLEDPNRQPDSRDDPSPPTLDAAVAARVKALDAKEGAERKTYWVESEWSDPSEAISVPPSPQRMLAGTVVPPREIELRSPGKTGAAPKFVEKEPQATVAASVWDDELAVRVTTELDLFRGSVLNAVKPVDVLHPITLQFHTLDKYPFVTDSVLLDIRGGEPLPGKRSSDKNEAYVPGEFLLVDKYGNLQVGNEFDDTQEYRQELFIEDIPPVVSTMMPGMPDGPATAEYGKTTTKPGKAGPPSPPGYPGPTTGKKAGKEMSPPMYPGPMPGGKKGKNTGPPMYPSPMPGGKKGSGRGS